MNSTGRGAIRRYFSFRIVYRVVELTALRVCPIFGRKAHTERLRALQKIRPVNMVDGMNVINAPTLCNVKIENKPGSTFVNY